MHKTQDENAAVGVSVIIPIINFSYNQKKNLQKLLDLRFKNIEYIFLIDDDLDSDDFGFLADNPFAKPGYGKYKDVSLAVNEGIKIAQGEYISIFYSENIPFQNMYESLYEIADKDLSDIVFGNYRIYLTQDGANVGIIDNGEMEGLPLSDKKTDSDTCALTEVFSLTPHIPAALFKTSFLRNNNISAKSGEDKDILFWYRAIISSAHISFIKTPVLYISREMSKSVQMEALDFEALFKNLNASLDEIEKNAGADELDAFYDHVFNELIKTDSHPLLAKNKNNIKSLKAFVERLDEGIVSKKPDMRFKLLYYKYKSPLFEIKSKSPKILIYNWLPFDNPWGWGGGVTVYCKNIIDELRRACPDVNIFFLSSGFAYLGKTMETFVRRIDNIFGDSVETFEIVNSPIPAEQRYLYVNPLVALENESLKNAFSEFLDTHGPFDAIHFNNIEGLSLDVLDLKEKYPETKFVFSIHNYVPICVNGSYYMRHKHCNCNPNHTGEDCFKCTRADIRSDIAKTTYSRGYVGLKKAECISENRWIKHFGFDRLDEDVSPDEILKFAETATEKLNRNCDSILAVSQRVYDIAAENGFKTDKMSVSYIGTQVADRQMGRAAAKAGNSLKIVFLGNDINYEEKGYPFLLDSLSELEEEYASKIDLLLTVKQEEHAEILSMLNRFRSVRVVQGYSHDDLKWIFSGAHLSIVPVLWEDNLPQISIESVAYGVPVLSSSAGGAKELSDCDKFVFECGNSKDMLSKIKHFVDNPEELLSYWKHHNGLVTMREHIKELIGVYGIERKRTAEIAPENTDRLLNEIGFLRSNINVSDQNYISKAEYDKVVKELKRLRASKESLQLNTEGSVGMTNMSGKVVFQTEDDPGNVVGIELFKFVLGDFDFSDFYAEIQFVRIHNVAASVSDKLCISGTLFDKGGERRLVLHQADWKNFTMFPEWIYYSCDKNEITFFARHDGIYCGYAYSVDILTSRAEGNSVEFKKINDGYIYENEMIGDGYFNNIKEQEVSDSI